MQLRLNSGLTNAVKVNQGLRGSAGGPPKSLQGYRGETEEKDQRYTGGTPEIYWNNTVASAYHLPGMSHALRSRQEPHTGIAPDRRQAPTFSARFHLVLPPALLSPYVQVFEGSPSGCRLRQIACARRAAQTQKSDSTPY